MISREICTEHWVIRTLSCIGIVGPSAIQYRQCNMHWQEIIWSTCTLVCHNYLDIYFFNANTSVGYYISRSYKMLKAWTTDTIYNETFYLHSPYNVGLGLHLECHVLFVPPQIKQNKNRWHSRSLRSIEVFMSKAYEKCQAGKRCDMAVTQKMNRVKKANIKDLFS